MTAPDRDRTVKLLLFSASMRQASLNTKLANLVELSNEPAPVDPQAQPVPVLLTLNQGNVGAEREVVDTLDGCCVSGPSRRVELRLREPGAVEEGT